MTEKRADHIHLAFGYGALVWVTNEKALYANMDRIADNKRMGWNGRRVIVSLSFCESDKALVHQFASAWIDLNLYDAGESVVSDCGSYGQRNDLKAVHSIWEVWKNRKISPDLLVAVPSLGDATFWYEMAALVRNSGSQAVVLDPPDTPTKSGEIWTS